MVRSERLEGSTLLGDDLRLAGQESRLLEDAIDADRAGGDDVGIEQS